MSQYFPPGTELLHSFYGAATTSVPAAAAATITAGIPEVIVPASYMTGLGKKSSSLCLKFGGYMTATATVPTFAFGLAYTAFATPPAFSASTILATLSNTITPTAATGSFEAEMNLGLRSMGLGNASTIWASGRVWASPALTTSVWWLNPLGAGGTHGDDLADRPGILPLAVPHPGRSHRIEHGHRPVHQAVRRKLTLRAVARGNQL